ncbi:MAG: TetR/AcrR family transcriptional regulator [Bradyrhizobium sp.]
MSKTPTIPANAVRPARGPGGRNAAAAAPGGPETPKLQPNRAERAADRRQAIVEAALEEFVARGFAATRLDDVAKRAGVAKGTIYLHFKDKETLFEELVRTAIVPLINRLTAPPSPDGSIRDALEGFAKTFIQEVATTRRGDIIRLIVAEGPRFPAIADFYYREVVSRGLAAMRALIEIGIARGEIRFPELARFPQIVVAPAIVGVIWKSLFDRHSPLDATAMLRVHLDMIFGERRTA